MTISHKRVLLSDRVGFTEILDPKQKTNTLKLCLFQPLSPDSAAACALASDLITSTNAQYPTNAQMNRKLHLLYHANLGASISKQGDLQMITLNASAIADRYALHGEAICDTLTDILLDCLLHPNVTDGKFDETEFRVKQMELLDAIENEINEKRTYAIHQAQKTAYQDEPAAYSAYGTREEALALTPASVYAAFQKLLQTARVEIFFVGPEPKADLGEKFAAAFATFGQNAAVPISFQSPSPTKDQPALVRETLPVNQCKLVMVWKSTCSNRYAANMAALLLGGTPSSKLFTNVREKMSLCYYCAANYSAYKQALFVDSGIETENLEKAKAAIQQQLDALCAGDITDTEIFSVQMALHNAYCGVGDSASSHIGWYLSQLSYGTDHTPQEEEAMYQKLTREEIVAAAKSMQLDTIYTMECEA